MGVGGLQAIDWAAILEHLLAGRDLDEDAAAGVLGRMITGDVDPAVVAGVLVALRAKGESATEIAGFVRAMTDAATPVAVAGPLLDTCGTGGDGSGTFNISTVSAVVAAAAGVRVAKHGNRSASGQCGSADLLEAWGVVIDLTAEGVATTIEELGIGFLFARTFHPAMRHVAPVRATLGIRTVFNVLGPLCNPAGATHQVVGVADRALAPRMAQALFHLGRERALVFRGADGLDELTTTGTSEVWEVDGDGVRTWVLDPATLGLAAASPADLIGGGVDRNRRIADEVLAGTAGPRLDVVALNAGAALWTAGAVDDLAAGIERARGVLASGAAAELRDRWVARSRQLAQT